MNKQEFKSYSAEVKAVGGKGNEGIVEAIVSVFGNIDFGGDRVVEGAFTESLASWAAKGDPLPFIWSHEWDDPEAHIGYVLQAEERPEGLWVRAQIDIDRPFAEQVYHLLKTRRVTQFSFGYTVQDSRVVVDPDGTEVRELLQVDVFEVGPTLLGMNPATQLIEAASALRGAKAGRVLSSKNEGILRAAYQAIGDVLSSLPNAEEPKSDVEEIEAKSADPIATKAIDVPAYMVDNATRGLDYYEQGFGGDGLEPQTVADARDMANGSISEEKVKKIGPWIDRHIVDLDASQNNDPQDPNYPGAGLVAMLLWGGGPDKEGAMRTRNWARDTAASLEQPKEVSTTEVEVESVSCDNDAKIDPEEITVLLTRTRHSEE